MALLSEGLSRPLTLVSAPAGFGKTTLLSEWRATSVGKDFSLAWLSLDSEDNEPSRFMTYLAASLGMLRVGIGNSALAVLQSQQPPPAEVLLTNLLSELDALLEPFALVLDDYHVITSQSVHQAIGFLLDHLPSKMHLVLLTRADPPLPLPRLRARNQLTEIRAPILRFAPQEAAQFLNEVMGLELSAEDVVALETRTEGWIAGLQLAALSLRQQDDKHAFVTAFAGDDRYIMDYLLEEVLHRQSPEVQTFLLQTSILERLSGPLCAAVTGETASQDMLAHLEQANLFVEPLDNLRHWYRYHHLLADLLRRRLQQSTTPSARKLLYRQACAWYEAQGLIVEAVSQALSAPDFDLSADMMERHVLTVFFRGETMLVHNWLKALPEAIIQTRPLLCAMLANTIAHSGSFRAAALSQTNHWLERGEQLLLDQARESGTPGGSDRPQDNLTRSFIAMSRAYLALWRGDAPQIIIRLARQALAGLPPADEEPFDLNFQRLRSALTNNLGLSYLRLGDEEAAIQAYAEAQRIGEACGDLLNMYTAIASLVSILRRHGRYAEAAALCRKTISASEAAGAQPERSIPYIGVIYIALGQILLEWNDLAAAETALTRGLELSRLTAATDGQLDCSISLAGIQRAHGNIHAALDLLDRINIDSDKSKVLAEAYRARFYLAQSFEHPDSLEKALEWAEKRVLSSCDPFWPAVEPLTLVRVQIAQCRGTSHSAPGPLPDLVSLLQYLELQLQAAEAGNWVERMVELRILQALAWQAQNHLKEALFALEHALRLAQVGRYMRLFLDEGLPMRQLIAKLRIRREPLREYAGKLLAAFAEMGGDNLPIMKSQPLVEPLSRRELDVLRLLVNGSSNAEIAQALVISLNTTKKHVSHIFEKLGVTNRLDAARRSGEMGLVPPITH